MDYHSIKRSELQALCKEHKIPAKSTNPVFADKLSELLHVKQKPIVRLRTCIKISVVTTCESAVSRRHAKKVRFAPEIEYERSGKNQKAMEPVITEMKARRKSVTKKVDEPAVDTVNTVTGDVQLPVRLTRSRAHIMGKDDDIVPTNEGKQGRRAVKDVEKETEAVKKVEKESEPVKDMVVGCGRVTRSKAQTVAS